MRPIRAGALLSLVVAGCAASPAPNATDRQEVAAAPVATMVPDSKAGDEPQTETEPEPNPEPADRAKPLSPAPGPLDPDHKAAVWDTVEDPGAELLLGVTKGRYGKHYYAGNEKALHVYAKEIENLGGGYIGVGSDQTYFFMGWQRPELVWVVDYDPVVKDVHAIYAALFAGVETPADFLGLWTKEGRKEAEALIEGAHGEQRGAALVELYRAERGWIHRRLNGVAKRHKRLGVASFINDQAMYDFVRESVANGRVRALTGNLLEEGAVQALGARVSELGVVVRVLYLSNAEEYWPEYNDAFRRNVGSIPFDDKSIIVRTLLTWDRNQDYRYNLQDAENFKEWLARDWLTRVYQIVPENVPTVPAYKEKKYPVALSKIDEDPDASQAAQKAAKAQAGSD